MFCAEKYDEKSARQQVKRLVDILQTPPVLTMVTNTSQASGILGGDEQSTSQSVKARSRSQSLSSENAKKRAENTQDGTDMPDKETKEEEKKAELSEQEKRFQKNYDDY